MEFYFGSIWITIIPLKHFYLVRSAFLNLFQMVNWTSDCRSCSNVYCQALMHLTATYAIPIEFAFNLSCLICPLQSNHLVNGTPKCFKYFISHVWLQVIEFLVVCSGKCSINQYLLFRSSGDSSCIEPSLSCCLTGTSMLCKVWLLAGVVRLHRQLLRVHPWQKHQDTCKLLDSSYSFTLNRVPPHSKKQSTLIKELL